MNKGERYQKLKEQEAIIDRCLDEIADVGDTLIDVRDNHLYRQGGYESFREWCETTSLAWWQIIDAIGCADSRKAQI